MLVSKFAAGLFEQPFTDETRVDTLDNPQNRQLAREVRVRVRVRVRIG